MNEEVFIDPQTGHPEGVSTCDNCNKIEHSPEELATCIDSMVGPRFDEDVDYAAYIARQDASGEQWYCYPCNDYFPVALDACPSCGGEVDTDLGCVGLAPTMFYVTLLNRASEPVRVFGRTVERAKEIAVAQRRARKPENLRVRQTIEVDPMLFPHEGTASKELGSGGVYIAYLDGSGRQRQLSGDLEASA